MTAARSNGMPAKVATLKKRSAAPSSAPTPIEAAIPWTLPKGLEGRAVCAVDLITEAQRPPSFVIDRLVEAGDLMLITGVEKDSLKTWLAVRLALARILGGEWLGFKVAPSKPKRVLMISTETRNTPLVRRHIAMCAGEDVDAAIASKFLYVIDEPVTLIPSAERERVYQKAYAGAKMAALRIPAGSRDAAEHGRIETLRKSADSLGDMAVEELGQNLDLLDAIEVPDTWSLIIIDTLRECLEGEENSSADTRRFMKAARDLARTCGCVVVIIHHSNKTGAHGEARSARGSGQITAAPDAIMTVDASGEYPTAHFRIRNHEPVQPVGYQLVSGPDGVRLDVRPACAGSTKGLAEDDVLATFTKHPNAGLTETSVRKLIAQAMGKPKGEKVGGKGVKKHIDALLARGVISKCSIVPKKGETPFPGYRLGNEGGRVAAVQIDGNEGAGFADAFGGPTDV